MVRYTCRIKSSGNPLVKDEDQRVPDGQEKDRHFLIDHSSASQDEVTAGLEQFRKWKRRIEIDQEKSRLANSCLLPPSKVSSQWNSLTYADLHNVERKARRQNALAECSSFDLASSRKNSGSNKAKRERSPDSLPSQPTSPRLNKAVSSVKKATPSALNRQRSDQDLVGDLGLDLDLVGAGANTGEKEADNDLITSIMQDVDFDAEFGKSPLVGAGASKLVKSAQSHRRKLQFDFEGPEGGTEEVIWHRTWFNAIARKKFSEASVQCTSLPYDKTNIEMDMEWEGQSGLDLQDLQPIYSSNASTTSSSASESDNSSDSEYEYEEVETTEPAQFTFGNKQREVSPASSERKSRGNLPKIATDILKNWLFQNSGVSCTSYSPVGHSWNRF